MTSNIAPPAAHVISATARRAQQDFQDRHKSSRSPHAIIMLVIVLLVVAALSGVSTYAAAQETSGRLVTSSFFGMHYSSARYQPWPLVNFTALRTWDQWPGVSWINLNPSRGKYDWSNLDVVVNAAVGKGVDIVYTFGYVPNWASTNPKGDCSGAPAGSCYMPNLASWKEFVTQITNRYKGRIKYWEIWNEPSAPNFWGGTTAQQVALARAAYPIIRNAGGIVLSPAPQGSNAHQWLDSYFAAGGVSYTDIVSFHGYTYGAPERIVELANNVRAVRAKYPALRNKPIWNTEYSWGENTGPYADQDQQTAWLGRFLPLSLASGIDRSFWYMWDDYDGQEQWGMLFNSTTRQIQKPGIAYQQVYQWLINATIYPCTLNAGVYQCRLTRDGGYQGLITWAAGPNISYAVPPGFIRYRTLDPTTSNVTPNSTLTLGLKPILLENR